MTYIKQVWEFQLHHSRKSHHELLKFERSRIGKGWHIYLFRHWFYIGWWPFQKVID